MYDEIAFQEERIMPLSGILLLLSELGHAQVPTPQLYRHRSRPEVHGLLSLRLPIGVWQGKLVSVDNTGKQDSLLKVADVAANAASSAGAEADEVGLQVLALFSQPPLGDVGFGLGEDFGITVRHPGGNRYRRIGGDEITENVAALGGSSARQTKGSRRGDAERLVKTSAEVGKMLHLVVGCNHLVSVQNSVNFLTELGHAFGILKKPEHDVIHGNSGSV
ncbi:unnamed protein product [Clonostachys rhizophaga]|uniref:Uncharacterized protein n=1 Tax=Clonostachys rhizophaga TaxID=160324 RepID=A0A9N9VQK6_9HYPO|nr:unnamed protein product [Clonostachys rhizophaga]